MRVRCNIRANDFDNIRKREDAEEKIAFVRFFYMYCIGKTYAATEAETF